MKLFILLLTLTSVMVYAAPPPQCAKRLANLSSLGVKGPKVKHSNMDLINFFEANPETLEIKNIAHAKSEELIALIREKDKVAYKNGIKKILSFYVEFAKDTGVTPTRADLDEFFILENFSIDANRLFGRDLLFDSDNALYKLAVEKSPAIKRAVFSGLSTPFKREALEKAIESSKGIIVTSAVNGAPVETDAMNALLEFANRKKTVVIIRIVNLETFDLDPALIELENNNKNVFISIDEIQINHLWNINNIKVLAKQINPLMGLDRLWTRGTNQIVASPKLEMKSIPTKDNDLYPHTLYTTGAITSANYSGRKYIQARTDEIAKDDHVIGALYLEKTQYSKNNFGLDVAGNFHARQLEYIPEAKGFIDLNTLYTAKDNIQVGVEAMALGDLHVGSTHQWLLESLKPVIQKLRPKFIVLHDAWDGIPVNHHNKNKVITLSQLAKEGKLDLAKGISEMVNYINSVLEIDPSIKVVIDRSNHPDWLSRWLESDEYLKYPHNAEIHRELSLAMMRGEDPFAYALLNGVDGGPKINKPKRIIFPEGSFKVGPDNRQVELSEHGDKGANGAKGSINSFARGLDRAIYGHTHKNERKNGIVNIGTFTPLLMPYNKGGFSNWAQSIGLVTEYGDIQVLTFDRGEWLTAPSYKQTPSFFTNGFPNIVPTIQSPDSAGQLDQYTNGRN